MPFPKRPANSILTHRENPNCRCTVAPVSQSPLFPLLSFQKSSFLFLSYPLPLSFWCVHLNSAAPDRPLILTAEIHQNFKGETVHIPRSINYVIQLYFKIQKAFPPGTGFLDSYIPLSEILDYKLMIPSLTQIVLPVNLDYVIVLI